MIVKEIKKKSLNYRCLLPDLAPWLTISGSNYPCLELFSMVTKIFEPLKFDCIWYCSQQVSFLFFLIYLFSEIERIFKWLLYFILTRWIKTKRLAEKIDKIKHIISQIRRTLYTQLYRNLNYIFISNSKVVISINIFNMYSLLLRFIALACQKTHSYVGNVCLNYCYWDYLKSIIKRHGNARV